MTTTDAVAAWPEKSRPPAAARWTSDRTEPVRFDVRTRFLYSDDDPDTFGRSAIDPETGRARHAFSRGGDVVRSDVPSPSEHRQDMASNLWRAIAAFGDDADLVVEVRRRETPLTCPECGARVGYTSEHLKGGARPGWDCVPPARGGRAPEGAAR